MTRGGMYGEVEPKPEENIKSGARGLNLYLTVYPDSSHTTDIINF